MLRRIILALSLMTVGLLPATAAHAAGAGGPAISSARSPEIVSIVASNSLGLPMECKPRLVRLRSMEGDEARALFGAARVARLATIRPDGAPHLVPVVFVLQDDTVWLMVDEKPKRHRRLQRLVNVRAEPRVSLLVDLYDEDWSRLWWVRADGRARIVGDGPPLERARDELLVKYPQEWVQPPGGPALAVEVERWRGWSAG
jgi:PPOX class probable F420-dependent enzyme